MEIFWSGFQPIPLNINGFLCDPESSKVSTPMSSLSIIFKMLPITVWDFCTERIFLLWVFIIVRSNVFCCVISEDPEKKQNCVGHFSFIHNYLEDVCRDCINMYFSGESMGDGIWWFSMGRKAGETDLTQHAARPEDRTVLLQSFSQSGKPSTTQHKLYRTISAGGTHRSSGK